METTDKKKLALILGSNDEVLWYYQRIIKNFPNLTPIQVSYGRKLNKIPQQNYLLLAEGKEIKSIENFVKDSPVALVVNRIDSYIPLHGKTVDHFKLPGPSFDSVMQFKNKAKMHSLMEKNNLSEFRPQTKSVDFKVLKSYLKTQKFPIVIKPIIGSKSRGVFIVKNRENINQAMARLASHFKQRSLFHAVSQKEQVLVEEFIKGRQVTCIGSVNKEGKLEIVAHSDVFTGQHLNEGHTQLVFRTTPLALIIKLKRLLVIFSKN
jgi:phosphoribosylamine-glycine ligase